MFDLETGLAGPRYDPSTASVIVLDLNETWSGPCSDLDVTDNIHDLATVRAYVRFNSGTRGPAHSGIPTGESDSERFNLSRLDDKTMMLQWSKACSSQPKNVDRELFYRVGEDDIRSFKNATRRLYFNPQS